MHQVHSIVLGIGVALVAAQAAAAELGQRFDSYLDMHQGTAYGSLFFNEGSIRYQQSRQRKRFVAIRGNGALNLPSQQGYCFVLNHYDSPTGKNNVEIRYRTKIVKWFADGTETEERIERPYTPTTNSVSPNLPDLCVSGIQNVLKVAIEFNSDDGKHFDWSISFAIK
jgi:hypothetical protein